VVSYRLGAGVVDLPGPLGVGVVWEERVTGIAPDEESIAPASGLWNKEDLVQKEMGRRCGIDTASTAISMILLWCVLARIRGPSLGTLGEPCMCISE
jgi:hypothetical protein